MNVVDVASSNLARLAYDPSSQVLYVQFKSLTAYAYSGVPQAVFTSCLAATSKGSYFTTSIRNVFAFEKLDVSRTQSIFGETSSPPPGWIFAILQSAVGESIDVSV